MNMYMLMALLVFIIGLVAAFVGSAENVGEKWTNCLLNTATGFFLSSAIICLYGFLYWVIQ